MQHRGNLVAVMMRRVHQSPNLWRHVYIATHVR